MFQHDQVFTKSAVAKQSVETCGNIFYEKDLFNSSEENKKRREKFFWTKDQRELIEGDPKRVLFTSNYGTGKTLVMRAKAMRLGKDRHRFKLKNQDFPESLIDSKKASWTAKANLHGSKRQKQKQSNENNLIDPGKTFFVLFSKPDALLFNSIHQEFEELKDHVEVICYTGYRSI
jgi:hypothetical protein